MHDEPTLLPQQTVTEAASKPVWRAPILTRLEIKRTMAFGGSVADGAIASTGGG